MFAVRIVQPCCKHNRGQQQKINVVPEEKREMTNARVFERSDFHSSASWPANFTPQIIFHTALPEQNNINDPPNKVAAERHQL